jgi:hypothetical protein
MGLFDKRKNKKIYQELIKEKIISERGYCLDIGNIYNFPFPNSNNVLSESNFISPNTEEEAVIIEQIKTNFKYAKELLKRFKELQKELGNEYKIPNKYSTLTNCYLEMVHLNGIRNPEENIEQAIKMARQMSNLGLTGVTDAVDSITKQSTKQLASSLNIEKNKYAYNPNKPRGPISSSSNETCGRGR